MSSAETTPDVVREQQMYLDKVAEALGDDYVAVNSQPKGNESLGIVFKIKDFNSEQYKRFVKLAGEVLKGSFDGEAHFNVTSSSYYSKKSNEDGRIGSSDIWCRSYSNDGGVLSINLAKRSITYERGVDKIGPVTNNAIKAFEKLMENLPSLVKDVKNPIKIHNKTGGWER